MARKPGCLPISGCLVDLPPDRSAGSHAVVRNELFQHRESIMEKLKKLPGCAHIKGLALRAV